MSQYSTLNLKLSKSQLYTSNSGIKNGTEVTLNRSSDAVGDSNDEANFSHKSLLTNIEVSRIRKAFGNSSLATIKFSKTQLSKMVELAGLIINNLLGLVGSFHQ